MSFIDWFSLFSICLFGAMSPGPSLAVVIKNALGGGKINGLVVAWSHAFGIGVYAVLTLFGLAILLQNNPTLFKIISYFGAAYLAYLGVKSLLSKETMVKNLETSQNKPLIASAKEGLGISILNPKIALFFTALFAQYITPDSGNFEKIVTILTPFITDGAWYSIVVLVLLRPKIYEAITKKATLIDRVVGVLLIFIAIKILFSQ